VVQSSPSARFLLEQVAAKLQGLSPEMMMVYSEVERSGNNGISSSDIKKKTILQQNTVTKATKELDRRKYALQIVAFCPHWSNRSALFSS
jgi:DNA-binding MarR family transcriptional regulator